MRPCLSPGRKETGCSEWQVNWWDLRTWWSGPDVEARRTGDGMPANPPLFPTPPAAGAALQREEGPVQVSTFTIWLLPLQPQPHKGWVYFYWLKRPVACARRFSWHQRRNVSGQALEILGYYSKQRVDLWQTFKMISLGYPASHELSDLLWISKLWIRWMSQIGGSAWFSIGSERHPRTNIWNRTQLNQMSPFCVLDQNLNKAIHPLAGS